MAKPILFFLFIYFFLIPKLFNYFDLNTGSLFYKKCWQAVKIHVSYFIFFISGK